MKRPEPVDGADPHLHRADPVDPPCRRVLLDPILGLRNDLRRIAILRTEDECRAQRWQVLAARKLPRKFDVGPVIWDGDALEVALSWPGKAVDDVGVPWERPAEP